MDKKLKVYALTVYDECIAWIIDYLENEIDFNDVINYYEVSKSKLFYKSYDLNDYLDKDKQSILQSITDLLEDRIITIHEESVKEKLLEIDLKKQLKILINNNY